MVRIVDEFLFFFGMARSNSVRQTELRKRRRVLELPQFCCAARAKICPVQVESKFAPSGFNPHEDRVAHPHPKSEYVGEIASPSPLVPTQCSTLELLDEV